MLPGAVWTLEKPLPTPCSFEPTHGAPATSPPLAVPHKIQAAESSRTSETNPHRPIPVA